MASSPAAWMLPEQVLMEIHMQPQAWSVRQTGWLAPPKCFGWRHRNVFGATNFEGYLVIMSAGR